MNIKKGMKLKTLLTFFAVFVLIILLNNSLSSSNNKVYAITPKQIPLKDLINPVTKNNVSSIEVNVQLELPNANFSSSALNGDSIKQIPANSQKWYIVNKSGVKQYSLPAYIYMDIEDISTGYLMPTYGCSNTNNGSTEPICPQVNGHYIATFNTNQKGIPYFDTANAVISYSAYFAFSDENGVASNPGSNYIACISGPGISVNPTCSETNPSSSTSHWTVQSCTINNPRFISSTICDTGLGVVDKKILAKNGGSKESHNNNKINNVFLTVSPSITYTTPSKTVKALNSSNTSAQTPSTTPTPTCESSSWPLAWLACSVINEIAKIEQSVENVINSLLFVKTFSYSLTACSSFSNKSRSQLQINQTNSQTTPGASSCIYEVWNNFRTYADVLLVIGFLVVIFAESIGGGLIDAYSIRKILPRILIAAILINLSIYIVGALVDITNIFGQGIYSLLTVPFGNSLSIHPSSTTTGTVLGLGFAGVVLTVGVASIFSKGKGMLDIIIGLLFMIGLPVLMAVLGILVTIIFRIAIIYFLTIISPIAFVLYILPNTEQYFKKWWKVLMEALLVYPIVFIVFAMSKITGAIVSSIGLPDGLGVLAQILGIAASLAPLFLIPFAFKIAGNTIGTVHDAVTKGRQRLHGGIKGNAQDPNSLQNKIKRRFGMATNNMGISKGALFDQVGNAPRLLTRRGREERRRRLSERSTMRGGVLGSEFLDKDGIWQKNKNNDKFLLAHADKDLAIKRRDEARSKGDFQTVAAWDQAISASDMVTRNNATMALSANQLASTGFGFSAGRKGYNELATMTARHAGVSFNDLEKDSEGNVIGVKEGAANAGIYQKMMNDNQFALRQAQRYDLGGVNDGKGYDYDAGMDKSSGYMAGNAKPQTWEAGAQEKLGIEKISGDVVEDANQLATNWKSGKVKEADIGAYMGKLAESYQGATGGNKKIIMDQMNAIEAFTTEPGISNEFSKEMTNLKNSAISGRGIDPNILNSK